MGATKGRAELPAYPQLVKGPYQGGEWTVLECEAKDSGTIVNQRYLELPRPLLMQDALARLHELAHIRRAKQVPQYGTRWGAGMLGVFRRMVEEIAIEQQNADMGMPIWRARDCLDWMNHALPTQRHDVAAQWLQVAGSIPHTESQDLRTYFAYLESRLHHDDLRILRECLADTQADYNPPNCDRWAATLTSHFAPPMQDPPKPHREKGAAQRERAEAEAEEKEAEEAREKARRKHNETAEVQENADWEPEQGGDDGKGLKDARGRAMSLRPLDVHKHTANSDTSKVIATQWRSCDSGSTVRYPAYLYPTGRVFGVKSRGGSILVDASGSMAWDDQLLEKLIRTMPGVWCAVYDGHTDWRYSGRLCVVAQKGKVGRRGDEGERSGINGGTGADLAALQYAARFAPKPIVWVSDGAVGDEWEPETTKAMKRFGIRRVLTIGQAIDYLRGKVVEGYRTSDMFEAPGKVRK